MPLDHGLEAFVQNVPSVGEAVEIPLDLLPDVIEPVFAHRDHDDMEVDGQTSTDFPAAVELMALPAFESQWGMLHDMLGGMVQMRTGAPCPLGAEARSEGGKVACQAAYHLIASNPALAKLILSTQSTFFGQLAAVAVHGYSCVQLVKVSAVHGSSIPSEEYVNE